MMVKKEVVAKEYSTTVKLYDANGQEVAQKQVTTNQFVSFEGSFVGRLEF